MSYRLDIHESAVHAVRDVAREQVNRALAEIADETLCTDATVHQVRKRCKKLRGLLRLTRKRMAGRYRHENARLRAAARRLAPARDAPEQHGHRDPAGPGAP